MATIVVTNPIFPEVERGLRELGEVTVNDRGTRWSRHELGERLRDADAMLAFMTDSIDRAAIARAPKLKIIACALKGCDNFDVEACTSAGVWLTVVPDLLTIPTAELAVALTLGLNRNLLAGDRRVRSGFDGWRAELYGFGLRGARVGIAGLGCVGLAIAERLKGFDARLTGFDERRIRPDDLAARGVAQISFDELIETSEIIIVALPLSSRTLHLFNGDTLSRMRRGARLVNVGRGSVVDETAVARSLQDGHLGGYAADVFELEDWARCDRPREIAPALLALPDRTLFTPHLGSAVRAARLAIEQAAADTIVAVLSGHRPANAVNQPAPSRQPG
ncbi:MAG: NAD(P)-dependent oxidoreductase [Xanthobacteraceae bacterium]